MSKTVRRLLIAALVSACGFASTITWYKLSESAELGAGNLKPIARLVTTVNDVQKKQVQKLLIVKYIKMGNQEFILWGKILML